MHRLPLPLVLLALGTLSFATGCGPAEIRCTRSNCGGCCTADNRCVLGNNASACGSTGNACVVCQGGEECAFGQCVPGSGTGGGTGGSPTGGGTGGGTGGSATGGGTGGSATGGGTGGGSTGGGTGGGSGGGTGGSATGGGSGNVDAQLVAVRQAADRDAGVVSLAVTGAQVTYLKPLVADAGATDPAGFFLQGTASGPGLFVSVDPNTVTGGPVSVGDAVNLTVTEVTRIGSVRVAKSVSGLAVTSSGNPIGPLVSSASATDLSTSAAIDGLESRLVSISGTVVGQPVSAGNGYRGNAFVTLGTLQLPDGGSPMQLRLPAALADAFDLTPGCFATVGPTPLWRFNARAQPSAWRSSELAQVNCPAPRLVGATATSGTSVQATFDRVIDGTSVTPGAFSLSPSLAVTGASLTAPRTVTVTTAAQSATTYTLTVDGTVTDLYGTSVDVAARAKNFTGIGGAVVDAGTPDAGAPDAGGGTVDAGSGGADAGTCTAPAVVISQVYTGSALTGATYNRSFVELHNRSGAAVNVAGWTLQYHSATGSGSWYASTAFSGATTIAPGGFLLVALKAADPSGQPITPDVAVTFTVSYSTVSGVFALVDNATLIPGTTCPTSGFVDLVGYGSTALCYEGVGPNGTSLSATAAAWRKNTTGANLGCVDTNNNGADFVTATPSPRNSGSAAASCTCP